MGRDLLTTPLEIPLDINMWIGRDCMECGSSLLSIHKWVNLDQLFVFLTAQWEVPTQMKCIKCDDYVKVRERVKFELTQSW